MKVYFNKKNFEDCLVGMKLRYLYNKINLNEKVYFTLISYESSYKEVTKTALLDVLTFMN